MLKITSCEERIESRSDYVVYNRSSQMRFYTTMDYHPHQPVGWLGSVPMWFLTGVWLQLTGGRDGIIWRLSWAGGERWPLPPHAWVTGTMAGRTGAWIGGLLHVTHLRVLTPWESQTSYTTVVFLKQAFPKTQATLQGFLRPAQKSHSTTSAACWWPKASHRAGQIQEEETSQGHRPRSSEKLTSGKTSETSLL